MQSNENALVVIIPAYEPRTEFVDYAKEVSTHAARVVVINDGSGPEYDPIFDELSKIPNLTCLKHEVNRGKGCALKTAFAYCTEELPEHSVLVTADCDGQHAAEDVLRVYEAARANTDKLVLGSRNFNLPNIPRKSRVGNSMFRVSYRVIYGLPVYDTQTGLRGFSPALAKAYLSVPGERFEYEMGMLIYSKRDGIPILEVPIRTIYPENPKDHVTHYRAIWDGMKIWGVVLKNALKMGRHRRAKKKSA